MKTEYYIKLHNLFLEKGIDKPYELLSLSNDDAKFIINNITNSNIERVIKILKEEENFIFPFGLKEKYNESKLFLLNKVMEVESDNLAKTILKYALENSFPSKEEWEIYIDNIFEGYNGTSVEQFLKYFSNSRIKAIEKIMLLIKNNEIVRCNLYEQVISDIQNYLKALKDEELRLTYLDLIIKKYNIYSAYMVIKENKSDEKVLSEITKFLLNTKLPYEDLSRLFVRNLSDADTLILIDLLYKVELVYLELKEENNEQRLDDFSTFITKYINNLSVNNFNLLNYFLMETLNNDKISLSCEYKNLTEINSKEIFNEIVYDINKSNLLVIINYLKEFHQIEENSEIILVKMIKDFSLDVFKRIIDKLSKEQVILIYNNRNLFKEFLDKDTVDFKTKLSRINNISELSIEELNEICTILKYPSFMNDCNKSYVFDLMITDDGRNSLSYIKEQYEPFNKMFCDNGRYKTVELDTVYDCLKRGEKVEEVLKEFENNEEITFNTLIRRRIK